MGSWHVPRTSCVVPHVHVACLMSMYVQSDAKPIDDVEETGEAAAGGARKPFRRFFYRGYEVSTACGGACRVSHACHHATPYIMHAVILFHVSCTHCPTTSTLSAAVYAPWHSCMCCSFRIVTSSAARVVRRVATASRHVFHVVSPTYDRVCHMPIHSIMSTCDVM